MIAASSDACTAHRYHSPRATYSELHHVVPKAWQHHYTPAVSPSDAVPGRDAQGPLWDARTVALCRTGHGNVHHWIVAAMRQVAAGVAPGDAMKAAARGAHAVRADVRVAQLALDRYQQAGGGLLDLTAHGLWGEI